MRRTLLNLFRFSEFTQNKGKSQYKSNYNQNILEPKIQVRNYSMMTQHQNFNISFFLIPPVLIQKSSTSYEIKKGNAVLGMLFIPKVGDQINWAGRKSFNLRLLDIGKILYASPRSGKSAVISTSIVSKSNFSPTQFTKQLHLIDDPAKETMTIILKEISQSAQDAEPVVKISIGYQEYLLVYELIKSSLFELSGWKFQNDLYKKDIMSRAFLKKKTGGDFDIETIVSRKGY